ncbi:MAG: YecA family protein [Thiogranum sp.]
MTKPGRNDPCPCGSGKKYKKCCLTKEVAPVASLNRQKMRRTEGELVHILLKHADRYYGPEAVAEAWDEFSLWSDVPMDPDSEPELDTAFLPWFVFNWIPDNAEVDEANHYPEMQVAMHYLEQQGSRLDSFRRRFIEEICSQPYSFFVVTDVVPGQQMTLRDLLLGREVTVQERQASTTLRNGLIIYTRIITLDDNSIMVGCAPTVIPAKYLNGFIDIREDMAKRPPGLDADLLHEYDIELREMYYGIREEIFHPVLPQLHNTDDDPLEPTKLCYTLKCTPHEALDALATLSMSNADDFIHDGAFDNQGELVSIEFPWLKKGNRQHAGWDNTVMGHITIEGGNLTIDVNSRQRADAVKRKITRRLGKQAVFRNAVIQSMEKMLEEMQNNPGGMQASTGQEDEDLMALPEVQEQMQKMAEQHWQAWLDTQLPALKEQTPREAAKTALGRERLEALFIEFAQHHKSPQPFTPDVAALRHSLGMD